MDGARCEQEVFKFKIRIYQYKVQKLPEDWTKQQSQPSKCTDKQETRNALPKETTKLSLTNTKQSGHS